MLETLSDLLSSGLGWIVAGSSVVSAAATWVLKPVIDARVASYVARRPKFGLVNAQKSSRIVVEIEALNRLANKRKPLNVLVNGIYFPKAGMLVAKHRPFRWRLDLSNSPSIVAELSGKNECSATFFFSDGPHSEAMIIKLRGDGQEANDRIRQKAVHYCESISGLLRTLSDDKAFELGFREEIIRYILPEQGDKFTWTDVYDGKQLKLSNLNNVEFRAEKARLLTKPRYAWVINFVDGEKIAIENVVLGHTEEGYCRGGVLRFENCKDVLVADTDLFGSGTYGLELVNCINVHFDNCTIRECSYGILRVRDCSGLMFAQCRFEKNRQFDLVESAGRYRDVSFVECDFRSNYSQEHLFYFEDDCDASIDFAHCRIVRNKAVSLTNREASVLFANSVVSDNAFSG